MTAEFWSPIKLSLEVALSASLLVFVLGVFSAKWMARKKFPGKIIIETLFMLPLVLSPSVIGFLLIFLFGTNSPIGRALEILLNGSMMFTVGAAIIAACVVAFPLMYQSAKTGFEQVNPDVEEASQMDGASGWKTFLHITLPLSVRSIVTGGILSFARALGEFGATLMFAGNIPGKTQTIPTAIYVAFESGNLRMAWMWVGCTVMISFVMLWIVRRFET